MARHRRRVLGLLLVLAGAGGSEALHGQAHATLAVDAGVRATSLGGATSVLAGGAALFGATPRVGVGGAGWLLMGVRRLDGDAPGGGLRLRVSYGGLLTGVALGTLGRARADLRLLVGAGNARLELPVELADVAVDNFLVVEPEIAVAVPLAPFLAARVGVGYRAVAGVEDLSSVTGEQLRGASGSLTLAVRSR